ncbi:MAG: hypothetical protein WCO05_02175, partial [Candidatus Moraniibacteriota bacterium]
FLVGSVPSGNIDSVAQGNFYDIAISLLKSSYRECRCTPYKIRLFFTIITPSVISSVTDATVRMI